KASEFLVCPRNSVTIENGLSQVCINGIFHSGKFHNVPISQFIPNSRAYSLEANVLRLNFDILRKVRHPDIVLLMGVLSENNDKIDSLILEPLNGSLHNKIHYEKHIFTFPEISSILSQILKAATYLHENGWVHSNICSHNIMLSRYQSNVVKLTSFELATAINSSEDSKKAITRKLTDAFTNFNLEEIPYKLLPYFIEYRQLYSEENYQSPELFATDSKFVFPTKQSDVYGITLILWELLNSESPCAIFGQLPNLQEDRCREYKDILKQGLEINPNKRIENTIVLIEMLGKVSNEPKKDASIVDCFTSLLSPKSHGDVIYGRTSTIKKKKLSNPERKIPAKQLFVPIEEKKIDGQKLKPNDLDAAGNSPQISNQIKYWNTIGTSSSTPNNINEDQLEKTAKNANVIQNSGIQFNEIFLKNHLSSNSDFENTLWRKEKEKCQSKNLIGNNTVIFSPSRVSVKDAINKFESFSKSFNNGSNENESNAAICKITKSKSFITKPEKRQSRKSISKSSSLEDINVSKLNLTLRNNVDENFNHKFTPSITPCSSAASEVNIDKIVNSEKPLKLTLNFKHLERRASDVGTYFLHSQPLNNERKNDVRGSIYGTEILKRLNKAAGDQNMGLKRTDSKKIKVGKLTCLNCGHKLFLVDDKDRGDGEGRPSEVFITPMKRGQVARSTEDLYIDDDFCEDIELGANMELGTRSELFDFIDFDVLAAEIFSQTSSADIETILNSNI
uniref:Protein kinase domain-containing protein n=1 Tax=Megaselia scalaris TaxID=36166 RepID=T1GRC8_MEGSC